jgi:ribosome-binding protein aMBF1 (putative translation factor)
MAKTVSLDRVRAELLADPEAREAYESLAGEDAITRAIIRARMAGGLTQAELAARMRTTQSVIARLESGKVMPSIRTMLRIAEATGTRFRPVFESDRFESDRR